MADASNDLARAIRRLVENAVRHEGNDINREVELSKALAAWGYQLAAVTADEVLRRLQDGRG